jgi:thymidine kinase
MFIEQQNGKNKGSIEVVCGSMFSGKTEELIRRIERARFAKLKTKIFKPKVDTRYHETKVVSHSSTSIDSIPVESAKSILTLANNTQVVGIDEAQFFDEGIIEVCEFLADRGTRVIIAGLNLDSDGNPFGSMPTLLSKADFITKLHAICVECGDLAQFTSCKDDKQQLVLLGETDTYEPLCRMCYKKLGS